METIRYIPAVSKARSPPRKPEAQERAVQKCCHSSGILLLLTNPCELILAP